VRAPAAEAGLKPFHPAGSAVRAGAGLTEKALWAVVRRAQRQQIAHPLWGQGAQWLGLLRAIDQP